MLQLQKHQTIRILRQNNILYVVAPCCGCLCSVVLSHGAVGKSAVCHFFGHTQMLLEQGAVARLCICTGSDRICDFTRFIGIKLVIVAMF